MNNLYKDAEKDIIDDLKDEIKYLKQKIKDYKYREEEFENEMDSATLENKNLKMELAKSREELKESRDFLMKQLENEELGILEIKHKSTLETLAKKDDIEKEYLCSKSISEKVINTLKEENSKRKIKEEKEISETNFVYMVKR